MNKKQVNEAFKKVKFDLIEHKPIDKLYSAAIVQKRELLLFAQVHLGNILEAKMQKNKQKEKFETEMYNKIMRFYYGEN
jgi:hypothetical protein